MKKIISIVVSFILCFAVLSGCSGGNEPTVSSKPAPTSASDPSYADSLPDESQSSANSTFPRTIIDAGEHEVTLDKQPERIAILHTNYLEYFFALGTPPAASAGASVGTAQQALETYETLLPYKGTAEVIDLGSAREINLEAVLEAKPDVIVTFAGHGGLDEIYDQLTEIAPVVLLNFSDTWQNQTRACAQIVGKEDEAEKIISETEAAIASAHTVLSAQDKTVALFRTNGGTAFLGRGNESYYTTFGITAPAGYTFDYATFSLEAVAEMNPDYIIFQDYIDISKGFEESQGASSVWTNLEAVKNGNIVYFDDSLNTFGPLAMRLAAEKLEQMVS